MSYPNDDTNMIYDYDLRQYKLTVSGVTNLLNKNIVTLAQGEKNAEFIQNQVSTDVYNYIANYNYVVKSIIISYAVFCLKKKTYNIIFFYNRTLIAKTTHFTF